MQHNDRQMLITGIGDIVDEIVGGGTGGDARELLRQRLDPLLDAFLLESQPIVGAEVTVLLADIRGFTALTQALPPRELIDLLNRFFARMCEVIKRHDGVIDKFIGDAVMALFGVPERRPDDLQRALNCAVEMQQAMIELNRHNARRGEASLYAGIAIATGQTMVGSFGSSLHSEYTVIGDAVNLAARMESFSLRGQVLISEAIQASARDMIETGSVNEVRVKGIARAIKLYELRSVNLPQRLVVPQVEVRRSPRIAVALEAVFRPVVSDQLGAEQFVGHVSDMGYFGMQADLPRGLPPQSEVVINLRPELGVDFSTDVHARVLRARRHGASFRTSMEFTAIDTPGHRQVKEYVDNMLWRH